MSYDVTRLRNGHKKIVIVIIFCKIKNPQNMRRTQIFGQI